MIPRIPSRWNDVPSCSVEDHRNHPQPDAGSLQRCKARRRVVLCDENNFSPSLVSLLTIDGSMPYPCITSLSDRLQTCGLKCCATVFRTVRVWSLHWPEALNLLHQYLVHTVDISHLPLQKILTAIHFLVNDSFWAGPSVPSSKTRIAKILHFSPCSKLECGKHFQVYGEPILRRHFLVAAHVLQQLEVIHLSLCAFCCGDQQSRWKLTVFERNGSFESYMCHCIGITQKEEVLRLLLMEFFKHRPPGHWRSFLVQRSLSRWKPKPSMNLNLRWFVAMSPRWLQFTLRIPRRSNSPLLLQLRYVENLSHLNSGLCPSKLTHSHIQLPIRIFLLHLKRWNFLQTIAYAFVAWMCQSTVQNGSRIFSTWLMLSFFLSKPILVRKGFREFMKNFTTDDEVSQWLCTSTISWNSSFCDFPRLSSS